jgi:hypothetical protein
MTKKEWANAVWLLFHTLADKLKPEYPAEVAILYNHISRICNNLPCPDCQAHATHTIQRTNRAAVCASRDTLIHFLWQFHNAVNVRIKLPVFPKTALDRYSRANTVNVVRNFTTIMSRASHNSRTMMNSFHRQRYMKEFTDYLNSNINKYNM